MRSHRVATANAAWRTHKFVYDAEAQQIRPVRNPADGRWRSLRRLGIALALAASGYAATATWAASSIASTR